MLMVMSHMSLAVISPARTAFWCPRLRLWEIPMKCSSSSARRVIMFQVSSRLPSFTNITRLSCVICPACARDFIFARNIGAVIGRTSCSL